MADAPESTGAERPDGESNAPSGPMTCAGDAQMEMPGDPMASLNEQCVIVNDAPEAKDAPELEASSSTGCGAVAPPLAHRSGATSHEVMSMNEKNKLMDTMRDAHHEGAGAVAEIFKEAEDAADLAHITIARWVLDGQIDPGPPAIEWPDLADKGRRPWNAS